MSNLTENMDNLIDEKRAEFLRVQEEERLIKKAQAGVYSVGKKVQRVGARVKRLEGLIKGDLMNLAIERSKTMNYKTQCMILRNTVLTVLTRYMEQKLIKPSPAMQLSVIRAIILGHDNTDEWWHNRVKLSIDEWYEVFVPGEAA